METWVNHFSMGATHLYYVFSARYYLMKAINDNWLNGTRVLLEKQIVLHLVKTFLIFMETESSLPHTQQSTTCPCPEPDQSSPSPPSYFMKVHFNITSHLHTGLPSGLFPLGFPTSISSPHTCYMPRPFRFCWFDHSNYVWWGVQFMKLLCHLLQSALTSSRLGPCVCRSLSLSQHPIHKHSQAIFLPQ